MMIVFGYLSPRMESIEDDEYIAQDQNEKEGHKSRYHLKKRCRLAINSFLPEKCCGIMQMMLTYGRPREIDYLNRQNENILIEKAFADENTKKYDRVAIQKI